MTRREKHKIESNCVSFDDDCYNETHHSYETSEFYRNIAGVDEQEISSMRKFFQRLLSFGAGKTA